MGSLEYFSLLLTEHHDRWPGFRGDDVARWLGESGLTDVAVDRYGQNCCGQSADGCDSAKISIFVASGRKPPAG